METLSCSIELKFSGEATGTFDGYASVFGVVDAKGDMVAPGAFGSTLAQWKARGFMPPMYMQHGPIFGADGRPVGVWNEVGEDAKGLKVSGRLIGLDTETGRFNYALVKEGAMRGLSIGYRTRKAGYGAKPGEPKRTLKEIDLLEISLVDDPANAFARVASVKSAHGIKTIREFEDFLRDAGGFSHAAAKAIAGGGFKAFSEPRDEDEGAGTADALRRLIATLK